jgi:hypothetical protein
MVGVGVVVVAVVVVVGVGVGVAVVVMAVVVVAVVVAAVVDWLLLVVGAQLPVVRGASPLPPAQKVALGLSPHC